MDLMTGMNEAFYAMEASILGDEIKHCDLLKDEANALFERMVSDGGSSKELMEDHLLLLEKFTAFEKDIVNFEILNYIYSIIARIALNVRNYKVAVQYAQAGIELSQKQDDQMGIKVSRVVLLDTACYMNAFREAERLLDVYPDICNSSIKKIIQGKVSTNDSVFNILLKSPDRPKSLVFCMDDKKRAGEKKIRTIMRHMRISRATALKYKKEADELPPGYFDI